MLLYPPTHIGIQNTVFSAKQPLKRAVHLSDCPSPAHMIDFFDFASLVSGSIFGPSTTFFGKGVLHSGIPG